MKFIKRILKFFFPRYILVLLKQAYILGIYYGQYNSIKKKMCLDKNNLPIPWYTYPAIEFLDSHKLDGCKVFEYGLGNSSLYFVRKKCSVKSIEHNKIYYDIFKNINKNLKIALCKKNNYVNQNILIKNSDIVVIDGEHRPECTKFVVSKILNTNLDPFMIIFDNSDWFPNSILLLDSLSSFIRVDFFGFSPLNSFTSCTSIYINKTKNLQRIKLLSKRGTGEIFD